jgi:hypothetical protein
MSPWGIVLAVLGALTLGLTGWLAAIAGMPLQFIFLDASILTKLVDVLLVISVVTVVTVGLTSRISLNWAVWIMVPLGALASAEALLNVWIASMATHMAKLDVLAPGLSQASFPLGLGLVGGAAAVILGRRTSGKTSALA